MTDDDLQATINRFIHEYNDNDPKQFVWTAKRDDIIGMLSAMDRNLCPRCLGIRNWGASPDCRCPKIAWHPDGSQ
jgi:hypothetical protein